MTALSKSPDPQRSSPAAIYEDCLAAEKRALKTGKELHKTVYKLLYFDLPVIRPSAREIPGVEKLSAKDRDLFERALLGDRCRAVFSNIKDIPNIEERWEQIARWA